jgi:hypothetical protein
MKKSVWLFILLTTVSFTCAADDVVYKHFEEEIQANPPARLTATVAEADLKLRVQPNLQAAVLVSLKKGDQVTIDYRTFAEQDFFGRRGYWFYCTAARDLKGWAFGFFLDFDKTKLEQIPIIYDAELFVRPQGKAKPIDTNKPPLPLMNGPGMVIKATPLFIDADGRIKIRSLSVYTEIEYFPVFINQLNSKGLVKIKVKVKVTGETGYIDLKSGADFPIMLGVPEEGLPDRFLIPAYSQPEKSSLTKEFISFGAPLPNEVIGLTWDAAGANWLNVREARAKQSYWIPSILQNFNWDNTISTRLLNSFINAWPPESVPEIITKFGQPAAWYFQTVKIWSAENSSARLHHLFYNGLYILTIETQDHRWWLTEFTIWDNVCQLNFGLQFNQAKNILAKLITNTEEVDVKWMRISETSDGWLHLFYTPANQLAAFNYRSDLETQWYLMAAYIIGFDENKIRLWYQDVDPEGHGGSTVEFGG